MIDRPIRLLAVSVALCAPALAACSDPLEVEPPWVELRTDRESYQVGDTAVLYLTNHHPLLTVAYHGCILLPRVLVDGDWEIAGGPYACPLAHVPELIRPRETVERPFLLLEQRFPPVGEYRWTGTFGVRGSRLFRERSSNTFTVEE